VCFHARILACTTLRQRYAQKIFRRSCHLDHWLVILHQLEPSFAGRPIAPGDKVCGNDYRIVRRAPRKRAQSTESNQNNFAAWTASGERCSYFSAQAHSATTYERRRFDSVCCDAMAGQVLLSSERHRCCSNFQACSRPRGSTIVRNVRSVYRAIHPRPLQAKTATATRVIRLRLGCRITVA
jgi:hypothetical protein